MKRFLAIVSIVGMLIAAGFAWQASVSAMATDMHGHEMGTECLAHCLMAASDEADVAAVATVAFALAAVVVAWEIAVGFLRDSDAPRVISWVDPGRGFLIARLD